MKQKINMLRYTFFSAEKRIKIGKGNFNYESFNFTDSAYTMIFDGVSQTYRDEDLFKFSGETMRQK